ncbi:bacillithiol biosynthesis cysteine-adding enzyme BshC [Flavihumibacter profundi]|uniref:bacillithiol biosynthesis cysteine-adding enzyme BshC n=1 Tax=Flavihumibacter profundi TaxID=2716883 RepID=UPI001CC743C2|nr:bacillithiol biosynthesis cysteine-adding enzyme BshC [Flavihumibacter profundi]MBZ5855866.1 bacillithiol biosynthesis cysteine-adding enzyme BshC [Flavihumibacter profundi]
MECNATQFSYRQTGLFNEIVNDYLSGASALRSFYEYPVNREGIFSAIQARQAFATNRDLLANVLQEQYAKLHGYETGSSPASLVAKNISLLRLDNTFTVCTAHQPNIFTGYLYFIYKILHAVKLANNLSQDFPSFNFVPVFYMGSEDADLDELGKVFLNGEKLVWDTKQGGAVGRMTTKGLEKLINRIEGELSVQQYGTELVAILKKAYLNSPDIQTATFTLLHDLFAEFGLVVLIADHPELKREMEAVFSDDLFNNTPSAIVTATNNRLSEHYKVQANPRDINLFYLKDEVRNRIERNGEGFHVVDTTIRFTANQLKQELNEYPERFSPNVILRGLYQETILPNIAFIGGGGELAYWLELKDLFHHYKVPYPVQVLRNSFLLLEEKWSKKIAAMEFDTAEFFKPAAEILNDLVKRETVVQIQLDQEISEARTFYAHLRSIAVKVDKTLETHILAQQKKVLQQLENLEKKLLRAEKRKFSDHSRQISTIKAALFPNNNLQERVENFMPFYAKYGPEFIRTIYNISPSLDQQFIVCTINQEQVAEKSVKLTGSVIDPLR